MNRTYGRRRPDGSRAVYYYHRPTGIRLPDDPTSPEFAEKLAALNAESEVPVRKETAAGTLAHAIEIYRKSPDFTHRAKRTRQDYILLLDFLKRLIGDVDLKNIDREAVLALRDELRETPRKADKTMAMLRRVLTFAGDRRRMFMLPERWNNPASRPGRLARNPKGHRPWEEDEVAAFEKRWKYGTLERTVFALLLNTGQRSGDIPKVNRHHVDAGEIIIQQNKTGERVHIPLSDDLRKALKVWMRGRGKDQIYVLAGRQGDPMTADYLRHVMRDACREAGLPDDCTLHGLRYCFARRAYELGMGWEEVAGITGWRTEQMARQYMAKRRRTKAVILRLDDFGQDRDGSK